MFSAGDEGDSDIAPKINNEWEYKPYVKSILNLFNINDYDKEKFLASSVEEAYKTEHSAYLEATYKALWRKDVLIGIDMLIHIYKERLEKYNIYDRSYLIKMVLQYMYKTVNRLNSIGLQYTFLWLASNLVAFGKKNLFFGDREYEYDSNNITEDNIDDLTNMLEKYILENILVK